MTSMTPNTKNTIKYLGILIAAFAGSAAMTWALHAPHASAQTASGALGGAGVFQRLNVQQITIPDTGLLIVRADGGRVAMLTNNGGLEAQLVKARNLEVTEMVAANKVKVSNVEITAGRIFIQSGATDRTQIEAGNIHLAGGAANTTHLAAGSISFEGVKQLKLP